MDLSFLPLVKSKQSYNVVHTHTLIEISFSVKHTHTDPTILLYNTTMPGTVRRGWHTGNATEELGDGSPSPSPSSVRQVFMSSHVGGRHQTLLINQY